jgi:hypothetical protein
MWEGRWRNGQEQELLIMTKGRARSGRAEPEASGKSGKKPTKKGDSSVQAAIGNRLRAYYDNVAKEPVPDRFVELLKRLDTKESGH